MQEEEENEKSVWKVRSWHRDIELEVVFTFAVSHSAAVSVTVKYVNPIFC